MSPVGIGFVLRVIDGWFRICFARDSLVCDLDIASFRRDLQIDRRAFTRPRARDHVNHIVIHDHGRDHDSRAQLGSAFRKKARIHKQTSGHSLNTLARHLLSQFFDHPQRISSHAFAVGSAIGVVHVFVGEGAIGLNSS